MSNNSSSTGTPTAVTNATDISGSHAFLMFPVLTYLEWPLINLTGGGFTTRTGLSESMFYFVNITTGWWSASSFTIDGCAAKETSVDAFSTSFFSTIMWLSCIVTECHTPTSSLMFGAILRIGTATIRLANCVPREVY